MTEDLTTAIPAAPDPTGRAAQASASGVVPVLHHINLKTNQLDALIEWYGKVTGMVPNFRWDGGTFLTNDAANHRIAIFGGPQFRDDPERRSRSGLHHSAFEFETATALLEHFAALKGIGITPAYAINHGLTTSIYYRDPDGNFVELQVDNYGDWAESTVFVRTSEAFKKDQLGTLLDPAALLAAKRAGMSDAELHRRSYAGEFPATETPDYGMPD